MSLPQKAVNSGWGEEDRRCPKTLCLKIQQSLENEYLTAYSLPGLSPCCPETVMSRARSLCFVGNCAELSQNHSLFGCGVQSILEGNKSATDDNRMQNACWDPPSNWFGIDLSFTSNCNISKICFPIAFFFFFFEAVSVR